VKSLEKTAGRFAVYRKMSFSQEVLMEN